MGHLLCIIFEVVCNGKVNLSFKKHPLLYASLFQNYSGGGEGMQKNWGQSQHCAQLENCIVLRDE